MNIGEIYFVSNDNQNTTECQVSGQKIPRELLISVRMTRYQEPRSQQDGKEDGNAMTPARSSGRTTTSSDVCIDLKMMSMMTGHLACLISSSSPNGTQCNQPGRRRRRAHWKPWALALALHRSWSRKHAARPCMPSHLCLHGESLHVRQLYCRVQRQLACRNKLRFHA